MNRSYGMWWSACGKAADTFPTASVAVRLKPVLPAVKSQHGVASHTNLWATPFGRKPANPLLAARRFCLLYRK
jgi:hypothetical protein